MPATVYLESTIISYLTARPSGNPLLMAHQQLTSSWWQSRRLHFDCFVSALVIDESKIGDSEAVARRMAVLADIQILEISEDAREVARHLLDTKVVPISAGADALHIAIAAAAGLDYLMTWNCRHIANAEMRTKFEQAIKECGFVPPVLCTPEELMGGNSNE